MNAQPASHADSRLHKIQQAVKWTVYVLLLINFGYYILEDWNRATHVLTSSSTFLDWTKEFATSIDEAAWFILLLMFELETYILDDKAWKGWVAHTVRGVRGLCFVMIAHTVFAFAAGTAELQATVPAEGANSLCDLVDEDLSYVYNLEYTAITAETCAELSNSTEFFHVGNDPVVADRAGLQLERYLVWTDLAEVIIWLLVLASIELVVRLQSKGITNSPMMAFANKSKILLYLSLMAMGVYWASLGHWLYFWDELVWILGFAAIEMNVNEWRDEIQETVVDA